METSKLKKFAQFARRSLIDQVSGKMQQVPKLKKNQILQDAVQ